MPCAAAWTSPRILRDPIPGGQAAVCQPVRPIRRACRTTIGHANRNDWPKMNRYPLWKYIVILVALAIGIIYTLPNFFGEAPAVTLQKEKQFNSNRSSIPGGIFG